MCTDAVNIPVNQSICADAVNVPVVIIANDVALPVHDSGLDVHHRAVRAGQDD